MPALRVEADSIWATLRPSAERDSVCSVELEASTPQRTLAVPGTNGVSARRNFSFLIRHDSAGTWRWMTSLEQPLNACSTADISFRRSATHQPWGSGGRHDARWDGQAANRD